MTTTIDFTAYADMVLAAIERLDATLLRVEDRLDGDIEATRAEIESVRADVSALRDRLVALDGGEKIVPSGIPLTPAQSKAILTIIFGIGASIWAWLAAKIGG